MDEKCKGTEAVNILVFTPDYSLANGDISQEQYDALQKEIIETIYLLSFSIEKCFTHQKRFQLRIELKPF